RPEVSLAAVKALGAFRNAEAERELADIAGREHMLVALRVEAARGLGAQASPGAGAALLALAGNKEAPEALRTEAVQILKTSYPALVTAGAPVVSGGAFLPTVGGAAFGAFTLYAVGTL